MPRTRRLELDRPVDLPLTLGPLQLGRRDPTVRISPEGAVRAVLTPDGPATLEVTRDGDGWSATAWGPGAAWALETAPGLLGARDSLDGFEPRDRLVARAHHRLPGLWLTRTGQVRDILVQTILAQKVTGLEAKRAWAAMVRAWGEPAPGPHGLRLPPAAEDLAATPYWDYHRHGVERRRAETIVRAMRRIDRLEEAVGMPPPEAARRLTALPGLGVWTAANVMRLAMGDPDAVEFGDFHLPHTICWALAAEPRGTDERMAELLEPYRGHRGRVVRLIESDGVTAPRYGPRLAVRDLPRR